MAGTILKTAQLRTRMNGMMLVLRPKSARLWWLSGGRWLARGAELAARIAAAHGHLPKAIFRKRRSQAASTVFDCSEHSKVRSQESRRPLHNVVLAEPGPEPVGEALGDVGNSARIITSLLSRDKDIIGCARAQGPHQERRLGRVGRACRATQMAQCDHREACPGSA